MVHRIVLVGFGTVSQGFVEILLRKRHLLQNRYGVEFVVVGISDVVKGSVYDPNGLDLETVMHEMESSGSLMNYPVGRDGVRGWDSLTAIRESKADTVIEATFTNVKDGQPGLDHCRAALRAGKHVVTTNKGPIALGYAELSALASDVGVRLLFEGTVMSGTPVLRVVETALAGNAIISARGILNGTSNYILGRMEGGLDFQSALAEAQRLGYAEADPTADIDGYDVQFKLAILAKTVFGASIEPDQIDRCGIRDITPQKMVEAERQGRRYKLIGRIERTSRGVEASVSPQAVLQSDPLAGVVGATNAITFEGDLSGPVTIVGAGAGRIETGYAVLVDLLNLVRGQI